jgi:hypothetical protein
MLYQKHQQTGKNTSYNNARKRNARTRVGCPELRKSKNNKQSDKRADKRKAGDEEFRHHGRSGDDCKRRAETRPTAYAEDIRFRQRVAESRLTRRSGNRQRPATTNAQMSREALSLMTPICIGDRSNISLRLIS